MRSGRIAVLIAACVAAFLSVPGPARAADPRLGEFVFDGAVRAISRAPDGSLYIGGDFASELKPTGSGLVLPASGGGGADPSTFPAVLGTVYAAAPDGAGGWYVGGHFQRVGNVDVRNLAHINAVGTADAGFAPNPDGVIFALARSGGTIYAGGEFTTIAGQHRERLAALDGSGAAKAWSGGANDAVYSLAVAGQTLYAGGNFTAIGGQARSGIAALDAATGAAKASWDSHSTGGARAIAVVGPKVYVAGSVFRFQDGSEHDWIAALDAGSGAVQAWDPHIGYVSDLAASGTTLYAVGSFTLSGHTNAAAFDTTTGGLLAWDPRVAGDVARVAVSGSTVYLGGQIFLLNGASRRGLAAVDKDSGEARQQWNPRVPGEIHALAAAGTTVYAGGTFAGAGSPLASAVGIAKIRPDGTLDTSWKPRVDAAGVTAIFATDTTVYFGGYFTQVAGNDRNGFAAVQASNAVLTTWDPAADVNGQCCGPYATAFAASGSTLYMAGFFYYLNGPFVDGRRGLAAYDMPSGTLIGRDVNTVGYINALATSGSTLYVGGQFPQIGGLPRSGLAALENSAADVRAWAASVGDNQSVNALAVAGPTLYAAGAFDTIGGKPRRNLAAVDTATGAVRDWDPAANATAMYAVAAAGGNVFASGDFTTIGGRAREYLAALDPATGAATAWDGGADDPPLVLYSDGTHVYAGGAFVSVGRRLTGQFAELDLKAPETTIDSVADGRVAFSADEPDARFECSIDGGAFAPCTSPVALSAPHTIAVRATDLSNNIDATPATRTLAVPVDSPPVVVVPVAVPPAPVVVVAPKKKTPSHIVSIPFKGGYRIGRLSKARACNGKLTLELRKGKHVLAKRTAQLDKRCRYATTFKVKRASVGSAKHLVVVVRFHGNRYLGRTTNRFSVDVPA